MKKISWILLVMMILVFVSRYRWLGNAFLNLGMVELTQATAGCAMSDMELVPVVSGTKMHCSEQSLRFVERSTSYLEQSIRWYPGSSPGYHHLAEAYMLLGNQGQAFEYLIRATQLDSGDRMAQFRLGLWYLAIGESENAITALRLAESSQFFLQRGKWYYGQGQFSEAEQFLSTAVLVDPHLEEGYLNLAYVQRQLGENLQAARSYRQASNLEPDRTVSKYASLGWAYWLENDHDEAFRNFEKAIALNPTWGGYYFDLGVLYSEAGNSERAIQVLKQGVKQAPDYYFNKRLLGDFYQQLNNCPEAIYWYQQAIQINEQMYSPWMGIGQCEYTLGEYNKAIDSFQMAIARNTQDADLHYMLGKSYLETGDNQEAIKEFEQALHIKEDYRFYSALGDAYYMAGNYEQSLEQYLSVLKLDPNNMYANQRVQEILILKK